MTTTRTPQAIIRRLKKEVHVLHRKEAEARNQLVTVFAELKDLGKAYEKKATANLKKMKMKLSAGQAGLFFKAIEDVEKQLLPKNGSQKGRLATIVAYIEKQMAGQFAKVSKPKAASRSKARVGKAKRKTRR